MVWRRVQPTAAEPKGVNAERESPPAGPRSPHDAGLVAAALWSHPGEGGDRRPPRSSHGPTPCRRLSGRRPGRAASPGRDWPRQRPGLLYGRHSGFAQRRPGSDGGRGVRPDRAVDRAAARADSGPHVSEGVGIPAASHPGVADPAPKNLADHARGRREFLGARRRPRLDAAPAGNTCSSWTPPPSYSVRSCVACGRSRGRSSGRRRFDVPGAWNAVARELAAITDATVANGETMCDLPRTIAARGLRGPVAPVLDDARCQRNAPVQGLAKGLRIARLFLPNPNPIGRLRRFMKRQRPTGAITRRSPTSEPALRMSLVGCPRLTRASRPPS